MKKGNVRGMIPLIVFPVLYVLVGVISGSFDKIPLMIGISIAIAAALIMDRSSSFDEKDEKIEIFCHGAGESTLVLMVLIFLLAGGFYGVANKMACG